MANVVPFRPRSILGGIRAPRPVSGRPYQGRLSRVRGSGAVPAERRGLWRDLNQAAAWAGLTTFLWYAVGMVPVQLAVIGQFGLHNPRQSSRTLPSRVLGAAPCPTLVVGMPYPIQESPICNACAQVREDSDGENWFCAAHRAPERIEHVMTPMTTWSGGSLM